MLFEHFLRTYIPLREHRLSLEGSRAPSPSALLEGSKAGAGYRAARSTTEPFIPPFSIVCIDHGRSLKVSDLVRRCQALSNQPNLTIFKSAPEVGPFAPPALAASADTLDLAVDDRVFLVERLLNG